MEKVTALKDLVDVKRVFEKYKTKFFLIYGTALGAYREGGFIADDYDIDLGSFDISHRDAIKADLEKLGFEIGICFDTKMQVERPTKMILAERNIRVDTFFFKKEKGEYVAWKHQFSFYPFMSMPLKFRKTEKVKLHGIEFDVIAPIEDYLEYFYGKDWRIPQKKQGRLYAEIHGIKSEKYV